MQQTTKDIRAAFSLLRRIELDNVWWEVFVFKDGIQLIHDNSIYYMYNREIARRWKLWANTIVLYKHGTRDYDISRKGRYNTRVPRTISCYEDEQMSKLRELFCGAKSVWQYNQTWRIADYSVNQITAKWRNKTLQYSFTKYDNETDLSVHEDYILNRLRVINGELHYSGERAWIPAKIKDGFFYHFIERFLCSKRQKSLLTIA